MEQDEDELVIVDLSLSQEERLKSFLRHCCQFQDRVSLEGLLQSSHGRLSFSIDQHSCKSAALLNVSFLDQSDDSDVESKLKCSFRTVPLPITRTNLVFNMVDSKSEYELVGKSMTLYKGT
jgi:hypothetical protein